MLEAKVRLPFASGDYEQACFAAMKAVEVAVRSAAQHDDSHYGNVMIQDAFSAKSGPLTDGDSERRWVIVNDGQRWLLDLLFDRTYETEQQTEPQPAPDLEAAKRIAQDWEKLY